MMNMTPGIMMLYDDYGYGYNEYWSCYYDSKW